MHAGRAYLGRRRQRSEANLQLIGRSKSMRSDAACERSHADSEREGESLEHDGEIRIRCQPKLSHRRQLDDTEGDPRGFRVWEHRRRPLPTDEGAAEMVKQKPKLRLEDPSPLSGSRER